MYFLFKNAVCKNNAIKYILEVIMMLFPQYNSNKTYNFLTPNNCSRAELFEKEVQKTKLNK